ncbi:MAG TPA: flippase, partial [Anaerolineae bacterium]|nr:flippase [Anaerolineae bacterium]
DSGNYAVAISVALWFDIIANWGLDALIIRDGAQNKGQIGRYLYNTTILRLFTMLLGLIPVLLFVGEAFINGDGYPRNVLLALGLIAVGMVFSGIGKGLTGVFYVFDAAEYPATLATVTTILKVAFGVTVLLLGWGFIGLAAVSILTNIITLSLLSLLAFRKFPIHGPYTLDRPLLKNAFRVGWPLMLNHLLATVFFKIDQPLLFRLGGDNAAQQVGWYNSAYKWVDALNIIPSFLTIALFPIISRQAKDNIADARRTFRMAVKLLVLVALPLAATITLLANIMIGTLGGSEFLPHGAIALRIVIWSIPIGWINSVTNYTIISLGLEKRLTGGFIVGVLFNTIGNILLIPRFGYVAAGFTTIASELILLIMFNYYLTQKMPEINWLQLLWRPVVITGFMLGGLWVGASVNLWLGLFIGMTLYLGGIWLLGIFGDEERNILNQILPTRLQFMTR